MRTLWIHIQKIFGEPGGIFRVHGAFPPSYSRAPGPIQPGLASAPDLSLELVPMPMRLGFLPRWSTRSQMRPFNARVETVATLGESVPVQRQVNSPSFDEPEAILSWVEVSPALISNVTDAVYEEVRAWQSRPLVAVYPILYFDALYVKSREEGAEEPRRVPER